MILKQQDKIVANTKHDFMCSVLNSAANRTALIINLSSWA